MTPRMRPSRVLAKLRAGEVANCFKLNMADPRATPPRGFSRVRRTRRASRNSVDTVSQRCAARPSGRAPSATTQANPKKVIMTPPRLSDTKKATTQAATASRPSSRNATR